MALIRIDINEGEELENSDDNSSGKGKPSGKVPERDRDSRELPELQITEIEPTLDKDQGIPPWMIPGILEIIDGNRDIIKKDLPN